MAAAPPGHQCPSPRHRRPWASVAAPPWSPGPCAPPPSHGRANPLAGPFPPDPHGCAPLPGPGRGTPSCLPCPTTSSSSVTPSVAASAHPSFTTHYSSPLRMPLLLLLEHSWYGAHRCTLDAWLNAWTAGSSIVLMHGNAAGIVCHCILGQLDTFWDTSRQQQTAALHLCLGCPLAAHEVFEGAPKQQVPTQFSWWAWWAHDSNVNSVPSLPCANLTILCLMPRTTTSWGRPFSATWS